MPLAGFAPDTPAARRESPHRPGSAARCSHAHQVSSSAPRETCRDRSGFDPIFTARLLPRGGVGRREAATRGCSCHPWPGLCSPPLWAVGGGARLPCWPCRGRRGEFTWRRRGGGFSAVTLLWDKSQPPPTASRPPGLTILHCTRTHLLRG